MIGADDPEGGGVFGLWSAKSDPCNSSAGYSSLAPSTCWNYISICYSRLHDKHWIGTYLFKFYNSDVFTLSTSLLFPWLLVTFAFSCSRELRKNKCIFMIQEDVSCPVIQQVDLVEQFIHFWLDKRHFMPGDILAPHLEPPLLTLRPQRNKRLCQTAYSARYFASYLSNKNPRRIICA